MSGVEECEVLEDLVEWLSFEEAVADEHSVDAVGVDGGLCGDGADACEDEWGFACEVEAGEAGCGADDELSGAGVGDEDGPCCGGGGCGDSESGDGCEESGCIFGVDHGLYKVH